MVRVKGRKIIDSSDVEEKPKQPVKVKAKPETKPVVQDKAKTEPTMTPKQAYETFREMTPGSFMKICPAFCLFIKCKHFEICWPMPERATAGVEQT